MTTTASTTMTANEPPAHFMAPPLPSQCSALMGANNKTPTTPTTTTTTNAFAPTGAGGDSASASVATTNGGYAPNYWKTRLRSRMAASRRMSAIGIGVELTPPASGTAVVPAAPRRRASLAVMTVAPTSQQQLPPQYPLNASIKEVKESEPIAVALVPSSSAISAMGMPNPRIQDRRAQDVPRVPAISLPLDAFLEVHTAEAFALQPNASPKSCFPKWQFNNDLPQYLSPNFLFSLHCLIAKIQTLSVVLKIFNRNLVNLRILVNLLLILAIFSQGVNSAVLKSSCKKVGYQHIIDEPGCDLVAVYLNRCSGYCTSFSFPDPHQDNRVVAFAKCCRMTDVELIDVKVNCGQDGGVRTVKVPSARECGCFDCAA